MPLPSWSKPRPPAGNVTGPNGVVTVYVPAAPKPWPTTLIAIDAIPMWPSDDATAHGAPFFESVNPCPKIATGHPPSGLTPPGTKSVNWGWFHDCTAGTPVFVPTAGITSSGVS